METRSKADAFRFGRVLCLALVMIALALPRPSLTAQLLGGTLVEEASGVPVDGAAVVLLDEAGSQISWRLTDPGGRFSFVLQRGGTFRLRADRIGHASALSDPIPVEADQTVRYRLEIPVEAIVLGSDVTP